jgi:hypothetical protein
MVWLTLALTTLFGLLLVWIATPENRRARTVGAAAVLVHTLTLIGGLGLEPTSIWIPVVSVIAVAAQAAVLGVVTLWIATRQSRVGRVIGAVILAAMAIALTYGMIFGPVWKVNVLIVAAIALTWIFGRPRIIRARWNRAKPI